MEEDTFLSWFQDLFIPCTKAIEGQKLLILDGYSSHLSLRTVELAVEENITILCLQAHSLHLLQ